jgi:hypothetical protein
LTEGVSYANWARYEYIDEHINEDNQPIVSKTTTSEEFNKMIESEGYTRERYEFVISN